MGLRNLASTDKVEVKAADFFRLLAHQHYCEKNQS
jgi:hypothetical protein